MNADWIDRYLGHCLAVGIVAILVALFAAVYMSAKDTAERKAAFMASCMADRKDYECLALWGQANAGHDNDMATGIAVGTAIGISAGRR